MPGRPVLLIRPGSSPATDSDSDPRFALPSAPPRRLCGSILTAAPTFPIPIPRTDSYFPPLPLSQPIFPHPEPILG